MFPTRWTVAAWMLVIVQAAVGLLALSRPTDLSASAQFTLTLGVLLAATLGARFGLETWKPFWWGFALFGWAYLGLSLSPFFSSEVRPMLFTTELIDFVCLRSGIDDPSVRHSRILVLRGTPTAYFYLQWAAHSQFALAFGVFGGALSWSFAHRAAHGEATPEAPKADR